MVVRREVYVEVRVWYFVRMVWRRDSIGAVRCWTSARTAKRKSGFVS
jgi:hypothetical protein